jgi:hypothetical protein
MGLFRRNLPKKDFTIVFNAKYEESLISMVRNAPGNYEISGCSISFPQELLIAVDLSIKNHESNLGVAYSQDKQSLEIVGESFHLQEILKLHSVVGGRQWVSGLLMPEPLNPFDSNAVALILIYRESNQSDFKQVPVGFLAKEQAKKVQKKILKLLSKSEVVPVLAMIKGEVDSGMSPGILAMAMTDKIRFD